MKIIFAPKRLELERNLEKNYEDDLQNLYSSAIIIRVNQTKKNEKVETCITHEAIKIYLNISFLKNLK
jgi:hypothetical protein